LFPDPKSMGQGMWDPSPPSSAQQIGEKNKMWRKMRNSAGVIWKKQREQSADTEAKKSIDKQSWEEVELRFGVTSYQVYRGNTRRFSSTVGEKSGLLWEYSKKKEDLCGPRPEELGRVLGIRDVLREVTELDPGGERCFNAIGGFFKGAHPNFPGARLTRQ